VAEGGNGGRTRTYSWDDPLELPSRTAGMSGIEALRLMAAGELPPAPLGKTLGFGPFEVEEGRATFTVEPAEFHYNPIGVVHGGLALALLDSAMGCAVQSTLAAGVAYTTLEVKANFVRPLTSSTGPIRCTGTVVHGGRTVATAEGRIVDGDGKLYAHGTSTLLIFGD
jgi:uncharacterized protein (TIGR00369 family)